MKIMPCPLNGPRNVSEFAYGGEVTEVPDPATASDAEWADHVFLENNRRGIVREWWFHVATAYWFIAERDTATDDIIRTYPSSDIYTERVSFTVPDAEGGES